jgi:murein DD-endopeptidase MepM/ murein hydrolase activator NlpD
MIGTCFHRHPPRSTARAAGFLLAGGLVLLLSVGCDEETTSSGVWDQAPINFNQQIQFPLHEFVRLQPFANKSSSFGGRHHTADDARGDGGTPVYAIADGRISFSGPMGGYGWLITIDHPDGVYSLYGHLSTRRDKVTSGTVTMGQVIAYLADDDEDGSGPVGGRGAYPYWGPHLHFSIRAGQRNDYPDSGDGRWMAGYTTAHPSVYGWLAPSAFIESHATPR